MAKKTLRVTATGDDKINRFWVVINEDDVADHTKTTGSIKLEAGEHIITYHVVGQKGGKLTIKGVMGGEEKLSITPQIRNDDGRVANSRRFTV